MLTLAFAASAAAVAGCSDGQREWKRHDICFSMEAPGATQRPPKSLPFGARRREQPVGPTVWTDYARVKYRDLNGDGRSEAIVFPSWRKCMFMGWYDPYRIVLAYDLRSKPPVRCAFKGLPR
jgi:hypothetical protein